MKKIIGWPVAQVCFYLGDWTCKLMEALDKEWGYSLLYPVYNQFMLWSLNINEWAGLNIWARVQDD